MRPSRLAAWPSKRVHLVGEFHFRIRLP
jgi:hypothetical protein